MKETVKKMEKQHTIKQH